MSFRWRAASERGSSDSWYALRASLPLWVSLCTLTGLVRYQAHAAATLGTSKYPRLLTSRIVCFPFRKSRSFGLPVVRSEKRRGCANSHSALIANPSGVWRNQLLLKTGCHATAIKRKGLDWWIRHQENRFISNTPNERRGSEACTFASERSFSTFLVHFYDRIMEALKTIVTVLTY